MIRLVEAKNFRSLRMVSQPLNRFQVQVGPNASGKTTFQDVVRFLGLLVDKGLEIAIKEFSSSGDVTELFWNHGGESFELAAEWEIPEHLTNALTRSKGWDTIRYEVQVGLALDKSPIIVQERGLLKGPKPLDQHDERRQRSLFPRGLATAEHSLLSSKQARGTRKIFGKSQAGNDVFNSEVEKEGGKGWALSLKLGPTRSALGGVPEDEHKFPISIWLRRTLRDGIQRSYLTVKR